MTDYTGTPGVLFKHRAVYFPGGLSPTFEIKKIEFNDCKELKLFLWINGI
jgi:hypothetical protein